jgi:predicted nucleotidyltransferase
MSLKEKISQLLETEMTRTPSGMLAVYLFGSCATGTQSDTSDVDLGFLFREEHYRADPLDAFEDACLIAAKIGDRLGRKTDVVVLNGASLELCFEIITTGTCLYQTDEDERLLYEAKIMGLWFDFKPFVLQLRQAALARTESW